MELLVLENTIFICRCWGGILIAVVVTGAENLSFNERLKNGVCFKSFVWAVEEE